MAFHKSLGTHPHTQSARWLRAEVRGRQTASIDIADGRSNAVVMLDPAGLADLVEWGAKVLTDGSMDTPAEVRASIEHLQAVGAIPVQR